VQTMHHTFWATLGAKEEAVHEGLQFA